MNLRSEGGSIAKRTVNLADVLLDVIDILGTPDVDVHLFGSRRFCTGSTRSDIDLLITTPNRITRDQANAIWSLEPYLDIFYGAEGTIQSLVNESQISKQSHTDLLKALDAVPLILHGQWQEEATGFQSQDVLAKRNPLATMVDLYDLDGSPPGYRSDLLVIAPLFDEFLGVVSALGAKRNEDTARAEVLARSGGTWTVEVVLVGSMGSVASALVTQEALRRTKPIHVILVGIAAGVPGQVSLGDVVIPEQIIYYEGAKVTGRSEKPGASWQQTDGSVRTKASIFPAISGLPGSRDSVRVATDVVMACGEKVVASKRFRKSVQRHHRKLAAIEMESYGVACAAARRGCPLTIIKGISDFADKAKGDSFRNDAIQNSALTLRMLIEEGVFAHGDE